MEFLINVGILFVIGWIFGNDRKDRGLVGIRTITLSPFWIFYVYPHIADCNRRFYKNYWTNCYRYIFFMFWFNI